MHVCHFGTDLPAEALQTESGHKKPGLNKGSAGINSVPGLFSELFNVAASRPAQMTTEWNKASPAQAFRQGSRAGGGLINRVLRGSPATFLFAFSARLS
jgi:hypothetical protein